MAFDAQRLYSVVEDFDGLHVVPAYRVIQGGRKLLSCASLAACGAFVAAYCARTATAGHAREAAQAP